MKVTAKYVMLEAVKDKKVSTLLFIDWVGKRGAIDTAKMHGFKALSSKSGTADMKLDIEDTCEATLKAEFGAALPHDLMYDMVSADFTDAYQYNSGIPAEIEEAEHND